MNTYMNPSRIRNNNSKKTASVQSPKGHEDAKSGHAGATEQKIVSFWEMNPHGKKFPRKKLRDLANSFGRWRQEIDVFLFKKTKQLPGVVAVSDIELQTISGHQDAEGRRKTAKKLSYWANELIASAEIMDGQSIRANVN
jgi:hypothetical protein